MRKTVIKKITEQINGDIPHVCGQKDSIFSLCQLILPTSSRNSMHSSQYPSKLLYRYHQMILKFICQNKRLRRYNIILRGKNKVGGQLLPDIKTDYGNLTKVEEKNRTVE